MEKYQPASGRMGFKNNWIDEAFLVENIKSELRYKIDKAFRDNKIEIPFPQRDIYMKGMPG